MAYVNNNASNINHRGHTDYISPVHTTLRCTCYVPKHYITLLKPGGNYMYHEDGLKESMRLHKAPLFGWGEEGRLVIYPTVTNVLYIIKFVHCSTYVVSSVLCAAGPPPPNYVAMTPKIV